MSATNFIELAVNPTEQDRVIRLSSHAVVSLGFLPGVLTL